MVKRDYESPAVYVLGCSTEGVLCLSLVGSTEDYNVNEEADW